MSRQSEDIIEDQPVTHCVAIIFPEVNSAHQEEILTTNIEDISSKYNVVTNNIMS